MWQFVSPISLRNLVLVACGLLMGLMIFLFCVRMFCVRPQPDSARVQLTFSAKQGKRGDQKPIRLPGGGINASVVVLTSSVRSGHIDIAWQNAFSSHVIQDTLRAFVNLRVCFSCFTNFPLNLRVSKRMGMDGGYTISIRNSHFLFFLVLFSMKGLKRYVNNHYAHGMALEAITRCVLEEGAIQWDDVAKALGVPRPRPRNWKRNAIKNLRPEAFPHGGDRGVFPCIRWANHVFFVHLPCFVVIQNRFLREMQSLRQAFTNVYNEGTTIGDLMKRLRSNNAGVHWDRIANVDRADNHWKDKLVKSIWPDKFKQGGWKGMLKIPINMEVKRVHDNFVLP